MSKAIIIHEPGDTSKMQWADQPLLDVDHHQVRLRHTVAGFNMIDTYMRKGLYPVELPAVLGVEGVGVVEELGVEVADLSVGDRVVYMGREPGSYSQQRIIDAQGLIKIPDTISDEVAAASFLKGLTAWALLTSSYEVKSGDVVLIYAAAGGLGSIMCQWAKALGARVIGIVGAKEKVSLAKKFGCDEVIDRSVQEVVASVKALTDGEGVQVVYDSLGAKTFDDSLDCLAPLGTMVSLGNATGPVPPFSIMTLAAKGSLKLVRPQVFSYVEKRADLERGAKALFDAIASGKVTIDIGSVFSVSEAAKAHDAVESQKTTGAIVLSI